MDIVAALAYLVEHSNYDDTGRIMSPSTDRIERLMELMGDPQRAAPAIHITGTNGKGSTAQILTRLLVAQGLTVGTFTSPHLERVNERINRNGEPISDDELAEQIGAVADLEVLAGVEPSYFEIVTAAAFRWFADVAVDVMVIEVGLLGRWDATNVVDAAVAVVTNVGDDHLEYAGPTLADVATEKSGIVKPGSTLVLGETDPELVAIFRAAGAERVVERGVGFDVLENQLALGGRLLALRTPSTIYNDLYLPLHGRYQGDNAVGRPGRGRGLLRRSAGPGRGGGGVRRGDDARPLRGAGPPAARHRRRRPQPARRGQLRRGAVRRLRPGRQEDPGGRLPGRP